MPGYAGHNFNRGHFRPEITFKTCVYASPSKDAEFILGKGGPPVYDGLTIIGIRLNRIIYVSCRHSYVGRASAFRKDRSVRIFYMFETTRSGVRGRSLGFLRFFPWKFF